MDERKFNEATKILRGLLKPRKDASGFFQPADETLYDVPPPGERELFVSIFERPVELRPEVELRGYAAGGLWEEFRRLEGDAGPQGTSARQ